MRAYSCHNHYSQSSGLLRMIVVNKLNISGVIWLIGIGRIKIVFCCQDRPYHQDYPINEIKSCGLSWNLIESYKIS
jgi:hypothetical protein